MTWILLLADTHFGGLRALLPRGATITVEGASKKGQVEKHPILLTVGQKYLLDCFENMQEQVFSYIPRLDASIVVGDCLQGHRDRWSTRLCLPSITDQVNAAVLQLEPLRRKSRKMWFLAGTQFHGLDFANSELSVAEKLKANYVSWLHLRTNGKIINAAHGHATGFIYRTTMLERECFFATLAARANQAPMPDIIVRAHIHFFASTVFKEIIAMFLPGWMLPEEGLATRMASFYKAHPMIGAVLMEVTKQPMPEGVRVIPITYDVCPEIEDEIVEL